MSTYFRKFRAFLRKNENVRGLFIVGILILGAFAAWEGTLFALNTQHPFVVVSSGSMCPPESCTLPIGAMLILKGESASSILQGPPCGQQAVGPNVSPAQLGSIIVFRPYPTQPDYLVVHRVREILPPVNGQLQFRTEGDNWHTNPACDNWIVAQSDIVGVYQYTVPIPYLGTVVLDIQYFMYGSSCDQSGCQLSSQGWLLIIALIVGLIALEVVEPSKKPEKQSSNEPTSSKDAQGAPVPPTPECVSTPFGQLIYPL